MFRSLKLTSFSRLLHAQPQNEKYLLKLYGQPNITFTHGSGCYLFDESHRSYLDLNAGISVNALGHNHPAVISAIETQSKKLIHLSNLYRNEHAGDLAKLLVQGVEGTGKFTEGTKVFFCNSGTEANEAAFKFARKWGKKDNSTTKFEVVSFGNAFHGRTFAGLSATPNPKYQAPFLPLVPGFLNGPFNDKQRASELINENTCAVIMEPVQGEGGIHIATPDFMEFVRNRCDEVGALLIFDEIQAGLGRTGKLFSHQHHRWVVPDLITMAKPLANGIPIGAVILAPHIAELIKPGDHGTTFGGNPLATYVGKKVMEIIANPEFLKEVADKGAYFKNQLNQLAEKYKSLVKQVRGSGLIIGMEMIRENDSTKFVDLAREKGVLVITAGGNTVRIVPPLIISLDQIDSGLKIFEEVLKEME